MESARIFDPSKGGDEGGELVRLPCKIGDVMYDTVDTRLEPAQVTKIEIYKNNEIIIYTKTTAFNAEEIGRTVFRDRESAQAKMRGWR